MSSIPSAPPTPADTAAALKERFPALFGGGFKPLKLHIQADIQERAPGVFGKQALSAFFRRHTGSTGYLVAMTKAQHRFDLDGQPSGEVSDVHRQAALDELARRRTAHQAKAEQAEAGRRLRATLLADFERTTLTPANFCALKGIEPQALDALLTTAREEARVAREEARAARPPGPPPRDGGRTEAHRPEGGRAEGRRPEGRAPEGQRKADDGRPQGRRPEGKRPPGVPPAHGRLQDGRPQDGRSAQEPRRGRRPDRMSNDGPPAAPQPQAAALPSGVPGSSPPMSSGPSMPPGPPGPPGRPDLPVSSKSSEPPEPSSSSQPSKPSESPQHAEPSGSS